MEIRLPYYTEIKKDVLVYPEVNIPDGRKYKPYDLFCIMTQIGIKYPDIDITFTQKQDDEHPEIYRQYLTIDRYIENIENKFNYNSKCSLYSYNSYIQSPLWAKRIMPYLDIPIRYYPVIEQGVLYVNLEDISNYIDIYNELLSNIDKQLTDYWNKGALECSSYFSIEYNLIPLIGNSTFTNQNLLVDVYGIISNFGLFYTDQNNLEDLLILQLKK